MSDDVKQSAEVYGAEKHEDLYIQTVKGERFYMDRPRFDIEEMAHALGMQCRFTGHTREFYSVAEHCVKVSELIEHLPRLFPLPATPYEGLLHDAHEAYVSDIASPWKALIPDYRRMEHKLELACRTYFGLSPAISAGAKLADWVMLFIEAQHLLVPGVSDDWLTPSADFREETLQPALHSEVSHPDCWAPKVATRYFLNRYESLRTGSLIERDTLAEARLK